MVVPNTTLIFISKSNNNLDQQIGNEAESLMKATIESPETSGVCGADLTWYYQNGILVITGKGGMTDYNENFNEFISSYPYRDEFNVKWIKQ